jgi:hypothetical protein
MLLIDLLLATYHSRQTPWMRFGNVNLFFVDPYILTSLATRLTFAQVSIFSLDLCLSILLVAIIFRVIDTLGRCLRLCQLLRLCLATLGAFHIIFVRIIDYRGYTLMPSDLIYSRYLLLGVYIHYRLSMYLLYNR